jgi:hypothetical protein
MIRTGPHGAFRNDFETTTFGTAFIRAAIRASAEPRFGLCTGQ